MPHQHQGVIAVRVTPQLRERYTRLAERTGRSRGYYMRLALEEGITQLEDRHWADVATGPAPSKEATEEEFSRLMDRTYPVEDDWDSA